MTSADPIRATELIQQQHPTPVPVSERLPEPGDCDAEGRCWAWNPEAIWWELFPVKFLALNAGDPYSHWLPANALPLPVPQGEVE